MKNLRFLSASAAVALLGAFVACSSSSSSSSTSDAGGEIGTDAPDGGVACGGQTCAAEQYCFHDWKCGGAPGPCVPSASCTCSCDTLPSSCPETSPCSGSCGYFDLGSHLDPLKHQVYCFGS